MLLPRGDESRHLLIDQEIGQSGGLFWGRSVPEFAEDILSGVLHIEIGRLSDGRFQDEVAPYSTAESTYGDVQWEEHELDLCVSSLLFAEVSLVKSVYQQRCHCGGHTRPVKEDVPLLLSLTLGRGVAERVPFAQVHLADESRVVPFQHRQCRRITKQASKERRDLGHR